jgi:hypothetical protein
MLANFFWGLLTNSFLVLLTLGLATLIVATVDPGELHGPLWRAVGSVASVGVMIWIAGWYVLFRSGTRRLRDMDEKNPDEGAPPDRP